MKKMILMAVVAMMATMSASAQARFETGTFTLQPRIGGTGSLFTNAPDMSEDGKTIDAIPAGGSFTGLDLEYYLSSRIGLTAGIGWSEAGTGWENHTIYAPNGQTMKVKDWSLKTNYFNVPLTVNWYVLKGFALKTGLQLGFLTRAKEHSLLEYTEGVVDYTLTADTDRKTEFKKFDISIPVGLSYEFRFPIVIDLRFNVGLTKVNKDHTIIDGDDYRNLQSALTIGYKFKL